MHDVPFTRAQPWAINFFVLAFAVFCEIKGCIDYSRLFGSMVVLKLGCGGVVSHLIGA
jgi:hypothetical protein